MMKKILLGSGATPDSLCNAVQVIVCGLGTVGLRIFTLLRQQNVCLVGVNAAPIAMNLILYL